MTAEVVFLALQKRWLSSSRTHVGCEEGSRLCREVFSNIGQLCRLDALEFHPDLMPLSRFVLSLVEHETEVSPLPLKLPLVKGRST